MFRCCALLARNNIKSIARYYLRLPSGKAIRKKTSDIHVALKAIACEERDRGGGADKRDAPGERGAKGGEREMKAQRTRSCGKDCSLNRKTNCGRARTTRFIPRNTTMLGKREPRDPCVRARPTLCAHIRVAMCT